MAPLQKPGRSKQDYQTPADFLTAVKRRFGIRTFSIDLAASVENAVAGRCYTKAENALVQSWVFPGLAWLNPEFADLDPWVEKAYRESRIGARLVELVPAGVGANWWRRWVHGKAFVLLLNGRLCFVANWATMIDPATEKPGKGPPRCYASPPLYPKDCCLLVYGPAVAPGYDVWTWGDTLKGITT